MSQSTPTPDTTARTEMAGETCPQCGREKAHSVHDVLAGHCPKWWAIRDEDADADCARHAALSASPDPAPKEGAAMREGEAKRIDGMFERFLKHFADHDGNVSADDLADYLADVRDAVRAALASTAPEGEAAPDGTGKWDALQDKIEELINTHVYADCGGTLMHTPTAAAAIIEAVQEAAQGVEPLPEADREVVAWIKTLPDLGERMDKASNALGQLLQAADDRAAAGDAAGKAQIIAAYKALFGTIKAMSGALVTSIIERDQAREEAQTASLRSAASEVNSKNHGPWYLGAMNDGLFIIDKPPHLTTDPGPVDWPDGPDLVLNVVALAHDQAQAIVDAHNEALAPPSVIQDEACR